MRELVIEDYKPLYEIPNGNKCWGIALPCSYDTNKDGLADFRNKDSISISRVFHVNRVLGNYYYKYGEHLFYLGSWKNKEGTVIKIFSFPVHRKNREELDATMIMKSCEDLVSMCKRYEVDVCLLPSLVDTNIGFMNYYNCYKPILDVMLPDSFFLIRKKLDQKEGKNG